ncbi:MAG: type I-E CRISPR-associated protein Cse2/CasB [Ktedonobacterales bacterium]
MTIPTRSDDRAAAFAEYLASLVKHENRAALAALRRGLGKRPGEAAEMFPYVMPFIGENVPMKRQDDYFLVAALFAAHQGTWTPTEGEKRDSNIGASFRRLRAAADSGSIEKRFVALLNAEREDLPEHLRSAVSLLKAHEIPVNWAQLLRDLGGWEWESRSVQRSWAQAFWRLASQQNESSVQGQSESTATAG